MSSLPNSSCAVYNKPAYLGHCGTMFSDPKAEESLPTFRLLRPVFGKLWSIYDQYIEHLVEEVPWYYTERTIVGHLTAAAFQAGCCAAEEFSWEKGKDEPKGRVDWWMAPRDSSEQIWVETKQLWMGRQAAWSTVSEHLDAAAKQLRQYNVGPSSDGQHKLAIVFVRPYTRGAEKLDEDRRIWIDEVEEFPDNVDYVAYYWLESRLASACRASDGLYYPGLLICCREL